jgi:phosphonate transport system substrate-binding protein
VAIAPVISPEKSLVMYEGLVEYLSEALGKMPRMQQRQTYAEVNNLIRYRQSDVAFVCTYAFVRGEREFGMTLLAIPQIEERLTYHSLILVPASAEEESLLDLRHQGFASGDLMSNSGWLYPATWLKDQGLDPIRFFGQHVITGSHDRSVQAVVDNFADGAAVDSIVYEQMTAEDPSIADATRIILKSPPFGMPPLVVHPSIDPELKKSLERVLFSMHRNEDGRKILEVLRIDRFVTPDEALYDTVRIAAQSMSEW